MPRFQFRGLQMAVQALQAANLFKSSTQAFSCEYGKNFTNNFFYVTPPVAAFADLIFLIKTIMWNGFYPKGL